MSRCCRASSIMPRAYRFMLWAVSVAILFWVFWELGASYQEIIDPYIIIGIGLLKQAIATLMFIYTSRWTWRAIGIMSVVQGVAIIYLGSGFLYYHPGAYSALAEPITDLGRSFMIAGALPLLIGLLQYTGSAIAADRRDRSEQSLDI